MVIVIAYYCILFPLFLFEIILVLKAAANCKRVYAVVQKDSPTKALCQNDLLQMWSTIKLQLQEPV